MKPLLLSFALLFAVSCATHTSEKFFRVVPAQPSYILQSPDLENIPFPQVGGRYTRLGPGWVDLRPNMGLRVEKAYFREGALKQDIESFLGTEIARYRAGTNGRLRLISVPSGIAERPTQQAPVQDLLPDAVALYRYHRFFYQVLFTAKGRNRGAVLLGARSTAELERLGSRLLADPDAVCAEGAARCAVFPEACTASVEIEVVINGRTQPVVWGISLMNVAFRAKYLELLRNHASRLTPVKIDPGDRNALQLTLLPGDYVNWK